jgi:hypothetical protein
MSTRITAERALRALIAFLTVSAIYLYAFPQANVFYAVVVLLHAMAGLAATLWLASFLWRQLRAGTTLSSIGWVLLTVGGILGIALIRLGTSREHWNWLYAHLTLSFLGVAFMFANLARERGWFRGSAFVQVGLPLLLVAIAFPVGKYVREGLWNARSANRIENPKLAPASMDGEGDGPHGAFFPSSAQV